MYHRVRRKMNYSFISAILLLLSYVSWAKTIDIPDERQQKPTLDNNFDNNVIDFDEEYSIKFNKKYGMVSWHGNNEHFKKESHRYTVLDKLDDNTHRNKDIEKSIINEEKKNENKKILESTTETDYSVIPLELISTTENVLLSIIESTSEADLTVIPLSTTEKLPKIEINQTVTLPTSTQTIDSTTDYSTSTQEVTTEVIANLNESSFLELTSTNNLFKNESIDTTTNLYDVTENITDNKTNINTNSSKIDISSREDESTKEENVPIFTELDAEDISDVPEDYYDSKDVIPTTAPKTDALSVIFGLAGSVVESVAEKVVPKTIYDLFKRVQKQNEALEAERLRSREENGGLGQFGRGILKSISSSLSRPLSQLMSGVRDIGSLDSDRGFVASLASGVTSVANVANSLADAFKDRVQAIYPGTVWCGDGHSATARSGDLGLFFFTDTCCRQHDACKLYIRAGETKYGLTNTGLFTRSHCSCDIKFRECLHKTNSLVSTQIGLTYFNVLGPQCFRRAHPIVRCVRKTRITGQKCEEYELDNTKPKMWQWFDNETF